MHYKETETFRKLKMYDKTQRTLSHKEMLYEVKEQTTLRLKYRTRSTTQSGELVLSRQERYRESSELTMKTAETYASETTRSTSTYTKR